MSYGSSVALQSSLRNWFSLDNWTSPFAVTLTLRQCVTVPNGTMTTKLWLTEADAIQNLRHFLNKLDTRNNRDFGGAMIRLVLDEVSGAV